MAQTLVYVHGDSYRSHSSNSIDIISLVALKFHLLIFSDPYYGVSMLMNQNYLLLKIILTIVHRRNIAFVWCAHDLMEYNDHREYNVSYFKGVNVNLP